jgi:hypothetical protein
MSHGLVRHDAEIYIADVSPKKLAKTRQWRAKGLGCTLSEPVEISKLPGRNVAADSLEFLVAQLA